MRSKIISRLILAALISQMGLGTGCTLWHKWFGPKTSTTTGKPGDINTTDIHTNGGGSGSRPNIDGGDLTFGEFSAVLFDYDSATIKPSEFSKVEAVATALKGNSKKVVVAGNTDERGTAEYNRSLGERRAQAGRAALIKSGIDGSRISTVSYGKDRPVEPSHDDTAWSRNRRDEFVIVGQ